MPVDVAASRTAAAPAAPPGADWRPSRITRRRVAYASWIAGLAWVFAAYDFNLFGALLPEIRDDMGWSKGTAATVSTLVSIGTVFAALAVGPLIDRLGRRLALIVTTAGGAISSGLTGLMPAPLAAPWLVAVRSLSGLAVSEQAVNATYLNELYSSCEDGPRRQGFSYSLVQSGWPIGVVIGGAFAALLLPALGWRGVFLLAAFPAVAIVLLGRRLVESPKYEVMKRAQALRADGRGEEAAALAAAHGVQLGGEQERASYRALFEPGVRRHTIFVSLGFLFSWFGVQVMSILSTTVLTDGKGIDFENSLTALVISNAVLFVGYLLFGWLGDRVSRRDLIGCGWLAAAGCYALMLFAADGYWPVVILNSAGLFFMIGPYAALLYYVGDSYPTRHRASGAAFVNAMGPIGAVLGGALFSLVLNLDASTVTATTIAGVVPVLLSGVLIFGGMKTTHGDAAALSANHDTGATA